MTDEDVWTPPIGTPPDRARELVKAHARRKVQEEHFLAPHFRALEAIEDDLGCVSTTLARIQGETIRAGERRLYIDRQRQIDLHEQAERAWMRRMENER